MEYGDGDEPSRSSHSSIIHSNTYDDAVRAMKSVFSKVKRRSVASFTASILQQGTISLAMFSRFATTNIFLISIL